jgi:hypothetical protein
MKKFTIVAIVVLMFSAGAIAQTKNDKPTIVVETMYILPKRGMDNKLEAAIKAHDMKFHPEGQYQAGLRKVEYGDRSVWLKPGQMYRFKGIAEKLKKVFEAGGNRGFVIFNNPLHTKESGDVSILWTFNSFDDWSKDWGTKTAFEKIYGEGSWSHMFDEWDDIVKDYNAELRSIVK